MSDFNYEETVQRIQADQALEIAKGNHPFAILQAFNHYRPVSKCYHEFIKAKVNTASIRKGSVRQSFDCEAVQLSILDEAKPIWDLAENNFKGRFCISVDFTRNLASFIWRLSLKLHFEDQDDYETFIVMSRLGGIDDCKDLEF